MPAVEIEVKPGVHFLVVFNDNTRIETIEKFIFNAGYRPENFGEEDPSTLEFNPFYQIDLKVYYFIEILFYKHKIRVSVDLVS